MKQKLVLYLLFFASHAYADPVLTFFFAPFPTEQSAQKMLRSFKKPHALAKQGILKIGNSNPIAGIFSSYYGFLNVSNQVGQTSFPRKQSKGSLTCYITHRITPIMMFNNTVSHWELVPGADAAAYTFDFIQDPTTNVPIWNVAKADIPEGGKIPATHSLIIVAKPKNIYVPTGATITKQDANLILPQLYAKQGINSVNNALFMLNLSFLFRPVDLLYKKEKLRYGTLVVE